MKKKAPSKTKKKTLKTLSRRQAKRVAGGRFSHMLMGPNRSFGGGG